eukprot:jgi/Ulvmu1/6131/UM027_0109.1
MRSPLFALSWLLGLADYVFYFLKPRFGKERRFFHEGYGNVASLRRLREHVAGLVPGLLNLSTHVPTVLQSTVKEINNSVNTQNGRNGTISCVEGSFTSPLADHLPPESRRCIFHILSPAAGTPVRAACVMLPATADTSFSLRRRLYADKLAKQGVVGILVIAPYYGLRKPSAQHGWFLQEVHDAFTQAWAVALEATALLHWARQRWGVPLAVTGVSYGAAMAALTSKLYPGPLAVVPFMGCSGPGEPFAHGVLRSSVYWRTLQDVPHPVHDTPAEEESQQAGRKGSDVRHKFVRFCEHFTSTTAWEQHVPDTMHGAHALVLLQARHDKFVAFDDGVKLFEDLKRVASAPCSVLREVRCGGMSVRSPRSRGAPRGGGSGDQAPLLEGGNVDTSVAKRDAELIEVAGGHVSGFLQCPWLLPHAVLLALERLQAKEGLVLSAVA